MLTTKSKSDIIVDSEKNSVQCLNIGVNSTICECVG